MKRSASLCLVLAIGCSKRSTPAPPPLDSARSPIASSAVPSSAASATAPPSLCTTFSADTKRAMTSAIARFPLEGDPPPPPSTLAGFCADTPNGAWRIEMPSSLADIQTQSQAAIAMETYFEIAHVGRDGKRAVFAPPILDRLSGYGGRQPKAPIVFDFDGDGEPELYVEVRETGDEGHRQTEALLLRFAGGHIEPYPAARGIDFDTMTDADRDGRPDLVIFAGYTEPLTSCASAFPYDHAKTKFIARAMPDGSFSKIDAAAKAYVRSWCPSAPRTIASSYDAICARLWAVDVAAARATVKASCAPWSCSRANSGGAQLKGATEDCERRLQWFDKPPPFTLP